MSKPQYLAIDTLDDRREIRQLLARLPPRRRLQFLHWCCRHATLPCSTIQPRVNPDMLERVRLAEREDAWDERLSFEVFFDVLALSAQYHFNLALALHQLVEMVRHLPAAPRVLHRAV